MNTQKFEEIEHLLEERIRENVSIPIIRKDFIID